MKSTAQARSLPRRRFGTWRRHALPVLAAGIALLALGLNLHVAEPVHPPAMPAARPAGTAGGSAAPGFRTLDWRELVPADWRPSAAFDGQSVATMRDGDPRTNELLQRMRAAWDEAPLNTALDGAAVRIYGYVVPLQGNEQGLVEFLLVPYFGACVHTPPPPANQIVRVMSSKPVPRLRSMHTVWVSGTLLARRRSSEAGVAGYQLEAVQVDRDIQSWRWN